MDTNTKHTPKSCSCSQCTRGKHSAKGHVHMKADERAYRHAAKIALAQLEDDVILQSAPIGNFYD
jgi:hypothetical protein